MSRRRSPARWAGQVVTTGGALLVALSWAVPLGWLVLTALRPEQDSVASSLVPHRLTLATLAAAWYAAPFGSYLRTTLIVAGSIVLLQTVTSCLAAYAFARLHFPGRDVLFVLYLVQMLIPLPVLVTPATLLVRQLGLVNTRWAMVLPYVGSAMATFLLRQHFRAIPPEYEDAARLDGASLWQVLWHVYLPLSRSAVAAFALVSFSAHWDEFFWPLVVTSVDRVRPLSLGLALFTQANEAGAAWQLIAAATLLVVGPVLGLFVVLRHAFERGVLQSGLR